MISIAWSQLIVTTVVILLFAVGVVLLHGSAASARAYLPFTAHSAETTDPYDIGLKKVSMLYVVLSCYQHILKKILSVNYKIFRQRLKENFAQANAYFLFDRRRIDAL